MSTHFIYSQKKISPFRLFLSFNAVEQCSAIKAKTLFSCSFAWHQISSFHGQISIHYIANKSPNNAQWFKICKRTLFIQFIFAGPSIILNTLFIPERYLPQRTLETVPTLPYFIIQLLTIIVIHDFVFGTFHYLFHKVPYLNQFHQVHHQVQFTCSIASNYFHPIDYLVA
jgi:sterol desaturase/sphingolipid hydroxylase (fatty acid hydroxylase superfamily)